jgi:hypothetical protein
VNDLIRSGIVLSIAVLCVSIYAEQWKLEVDANLTLNQSTYSNNWAGEEAGAISWTFNSNSLLEKQLAKKVNNKNTLKLFFGQNHSQDPETRNWAKPVKSTDRIDLESMFRLTLGSFVDPFTAGRMETQFMDLRYATHSHYLNPVTVTESFGVSRMLLKKEKQEWTARAGAGFRQHRDRFFLDTLNSTMYYLKTNDGGFEFVTEFKSPLAKERLGINSKLILFQAVFFSEADRIRGLPNEDDWKYPDVNWENVFTAGIAKYLMVNLYLQLLYDREVHHRARLKQTMALGLTLKLI